MNKCKKIILGAAVIIVLGLVMWQGVLAQNDLKTKILDINLRRTGGEAGYADVTDPTIVVSILIKGALGLIALIFFVLVLISGFRWMTAGGNEEAITKAKKNLVSAIIGLLIILFAYAITTFVFNVVLSGRTTS